MESHSNLLAKSLAEFLSIRPWKLFLQFAKEGVMSVTTHLETEARDPAIHTIFYIDGDVQQFLFESREGQLMLEGHQDVQAKHMQQLEKKIRSFRTVYRQVELVLTSIITLLTFVLTSDWMAVRESLLITLGVSSLSVYFRKKLAYGLIWIVRKMASMYLRQFVKRMVGSIQ